MDQDAAIWGEEEEDQQAKDVGQEILSKTPEEIRQRAKMLENEIRIMNSELSRINRDNQSTLARIAENKEKIKLNKQLPYLLKPGQLVGTNKDSYLVLERLPAEYDSRVKAMEVDEKPTEEYSDVGGLDKQIQELVEAVVLPMTHKFRFDAIGIRPPKGVLLYGPPGTGKTLLARACARQSNAVFLKLAGPQLVQMFIGDGAKLVRDAFELAKEKGKNRGGAIIFIDEVDAIGSKRFDSDQSGDREVQRTMLELLNQLDGFSSSEMVKVIAATNRPDILDPALMRSGRLDRKVELPYHTERLNQHFTNS
ncbi:hypothetical protein BASA82_000503 [Batrachochytrium salamandrivorans]|nr:hypothetical protein BASA82_000503 [Batrachochytrium salamandrivorans]